MLPTGAEQLLSKLFSAGREHQNRIKPGSECPPQLNILKLKLAL